MVGMPDGPDGGRLAKAKVYFQYQKENSTLTNKNKSALKFSQNQILPELFSCVM